MNRSLRLGLSVLFALLAGLDPALAEPPPINWEKDVVYGRKFGTALTMDVMTPKSGANGAALIWVVSGGWISNHDYVSPRGVEEYLRRGYTCFAVVHACQPRFTIPEVLEDMNRSVRFIRSNVERFKIDPNKIGVTGGSAGGHLSLMLGVAGGPGKEKEKDPIDRASSRVQAVACFFPPTDFLNWGKPGRDVIAVLEEELKNFRPPFDYVEKDRETNQFRVITDRDRRLRISRQISPITHVSPDDPPTLIISGVTDKLVPIQQSRDMVHRLKQSGVEAVLIEREGVGHGWENLNRDAEIFADWFDAHLLKKPIQHPARGAASQPWTQPSP